MGQRLDTIVFGFAPHEREGVGRAWRLMVDRPQRSRQGDYESAVIFAPLDGGPVILRGPDHEKCIDSIERFILSFCRMKGYVLMDRGGVEIDLRRMLDTHL